MQYLSNIHLMFSEEARPLISDDEALEILPRHLDGDCGDLEDPAEVMACLSLFAGGNAIVSVWNRNGARLVFATIPGTGDTLVVPLSLWNDLVNNESCP